MTPSANNRCSVVRLLRLPNLRRPAMRSQVCAYALASALMPACCMKCSMEQPSENRCAYSTRAGCNAGTPITYETCCHGPSYCNICRAGLTLVAARIAPLYKLVAPHLTREGGTNLSNPRWVEQGHARYSLKLGSVSSSKVDHRMKTTAHKR